MKTIGLIGGTSWQSTTTYYRAINETVAQILGGHHSAKMIMSSVDYSSIVKCADQNDWNGIETILTREAKRLEEAGADFFLICANTLHKVADSVTKNVKIPLLHIVDATAEEIKKSGIKKVGLIGTRFTMEDNFYCSRLSKHGVDAVIPDDTQRKEIDQIIFEELTLGILKEQSLHKYKKVIDSLVKNGAKGIILGCTEIHLLVQQCHISVPVFDTATIHSVAAAKMAIGEHVL